VSASPASLSAQQFRPVDFDPFAPGGPIVLPLTPAQQEVWMAAQMGADASSAYNQSFPMRLRGPLSIESMRTALAGLVKRHEALRATFSQNGESQFVVPAATLPLTLHDISTLTEKDRERAVGDLLEREVREPFDLVRGPLARLHLLRESDHAHVLVMTAHHLVCDGWSSGLLLRDLAALYTADRHGLRARLPEPMSYCEYVRSASLPSKDRAESEGYWIAQFADGVPTLELPVDHLRPAARTFQGSHERLRIEADLYRELKRLGARHGCSLYVTLLAAWQVLLFRLTHNEDFVVGIPVAGQAVLDNQLLAGHAVHVLPLRAAIEPAGTFADQLVRARRTLGEAHEHRAISFGQIGALRPGRDASQSAPLATVFNVDPPVEAPRFYGLELERLAAPRSAYNFEVGLDIADTGSSLQIECNYNADLFERPSIRRWLDCYQTLLASAAADDQAKVSSLRLLSADQRAALRWQGGAKTTFESPSVVQEFEAIAARYPDAIAVSFENQTATYGELNRQANRIAHRLHALRISRDMRVAICLERSVDLVAAIVGVMKARGAYVPFEPNCPTERLRSMMEQAEPRAIITAEASLHHFAWTSVPTVCVDRDRAMLASQSDENLSLGTEPSDLAYVIFTSGSTGRPKGVGVTQQNLARLFSSTDHWFGFGRSDVWTLFHSCSFDFSVWELWGALRYGGRLVIVPYGISRSPDTFLELIEREGVTVLNQTPSAFRQLVDADHDAPAALAQLRLVIFGGEALDLPSLRAWTDRRGDAQPALVNMYGITETTVHVTYRPIKSEDLHGVRTRIGVQLPDLDLHLLDPSSLELVPDGTVGEICVGGAGVARGYLNRPDLSASRFVPNPFGDRSGGTLYRSGDLARRRNDGDLEYLGRADDQVKVRGFRIELQEIEAALLDHRLVHAAAVVLETSAAGDRRLVAYVVPQDGAGVEIAGLREHLRDHLPEYMIPAGFAVIDALPINENGKLDRRRLPSIEMRPAPSNNPVAPRTRTEAALAEIWRSALELPGLSVADNFFDVGGHSMLAVKIVSRAREHFGVELPVATLFHAPTIAKFAAVIDGLTLTLPSAPGNTTARDVIEL
jgi:amino acid adenylation domain-containing protein